MVLREGPPVILIADDDPADRKRLKDAFRAIGSECLIQEVANGQELLNYLEGRGCYAGASAPPPNLIFLDLHMPGVDAREALRRIRANDTLGDTPVVGLCQPHDDVKLLVALGANSVMCKPLHPANLTSAVIHLNQFWLGPAPHHGTKSSAPEPMAGQQTAASPGP